MVVSDEIANAVMARSASWHHYLTSAGFKMHVESWEPLLDAVRAQLRALPLPEWKVDECVRGILDRALQEAEGRAGAEEARMRMALHALERIPARLRLEELQPE